MLCSFILRVVAFFKKLNTFDMEHCVSLRCATCYVDALVYCNIVAGVVIFITLDNYSKMLSMFIKLCIR